MNNLGVVLNASNPASSLNKKAVALAYHFVQEHQAEQVISIRKIDINDNYADPFTKGLVNMKHHGFYRQYMRNY